MRSLKQLIGFILMPPWPWVMPMIVSFLIAPFISYTGLALTKDNLLVTMCDCGVGRGIPKAPSLRIYKTDGDLVGYTFLNFPFSEKTKLRFMDIHGDTIYISDLGMYYVWL